MKHFADKNDPMPANSVAVQLTPKDPISIQRIAKLHPLVRDTFTRFILAAESELNITLRVTQGLRTVAEQNALYAQGRTAAGRIVTNAKGGQSYHNVGTAIDVVEMVNGQPNWNFDYSKLKPIADRFGIEWGGTFKSIVDKPHFEISFGYKPSQLLAMPKDTNGYPIITK
jgi:peptidoglycan L-alanyl-D-glutamate endopeptidase CwlK